MTIMNGLRGLGATLLGAAAKVTGRLPWQPAFWLGWVGRRLARVWRFLIADVKRWATVLVLVLGAIGGWAWYKSRPVPHYVTFTVTAPALTEYNEKGISSIKTLDVKFDESAA